MKIIVQSDDGKTQASVEIAASPDTNPGDVLKAMLGAYLHCHQEAVIDSITITVADSAAPAADDDGFMFRVGQRVQKKRSKARYAIYSRRKENGVSQYQLLENGLQWNDEDLEPAEQA